MSERVERIRQLWGAANPDEHRAPQLIRDVQTLLTALAQAEREREIAENTASNLRTRLKAYSDLVMLRPFKWLAVRDANEAVPIPEPESFAAVVEERDAARAEVERLREVLEEVADCGHSDTGEIIVTRRTLERVRDSLRGRVVPEGFWGRAAARALVRAKNAETDLARVRAALETAANRLDIAANVIRSGAEFARWADEARAALEGRG